MKPERASFDRLLESLADGAPVDWAAVTGKAGTDAERRRCRNLRLVARIAELHRTIALEDGGMGITAPAAPESAAAPPGVWGHLRIVKRLAVGTFGELYLAHDPELDRDVALKLLRPDASDRP